VPIFEEMVTRGIEADVDLALHLQRPRQALRMYAFEPVLSGQAAEDSFSDTSEISFGRKQLLLGHQFLAGQRFAEATVRLRAAAGALEEVAWEQEALRYLAASLAKQSTRPGDGASREAEAGFRRAAALAEGAPAASTALPGTLADLCHFLSTQHRFLEATQLCHRSLRLSQEAGNADAECSASEYLGMAHHLQGDLARAEHAFRRAVRLPGLKPQRRCNAYTNLCVFLWNLGRRAEAEAACQRCAATGQGLHTAEILRAIRAEASA